MRMPFQYQVMVVDHLTKCHQVVLKKELMSSKLVNVRHPLVASIAAL